MARRVKATRSPHAMLLSGPLGHELERHAERRAVYFFRFLFYLRAVCDMVFDGSGANYHPVDLLREAATHQIDKGYRQSAGHADFDESDIAMVNRIATAFSNTDAAHFCNLGLAGQFSLLENHARQDDGARDLIDMCKVLAGDTTWLPQAINNGPDRVIDQLHFDLALVFFQQPDPIFKPNNITIYAREADAALCVYIAELKNRKDKHGQLRNDADGLIACTQRYLLAYLNLETRICASIESEIDEESQARSLLRERYRTL